MVKRLLRPCKKIVSCELTTFVNHFVILNFGLFISCHQLKFKPFVNCETRTMMLESCSDLRCPESSLVCLIHLVMA